MRQASFGYILRQKAQYYPDETAIVDAGSDQQLTYADVERRSNAVANELHERGVDNGDRVCTITRNVVEYFDLLFATNKLGAVLTPLNHRLAAGELQEMIERVDPSALVYEAPFAETVEELEGLPESRFAIGPGDDDSYDQLLEGSTDPRPVASEFEDTAVILFTSGSTGRPKAVPVTNRNLFFSSVNWIVDNKITRDDTMLNPAPLFHAGGLCILTIQAFHVGGTIVLQQEFDPVETWELLETHDVTKFFTIPTMLNMMVNVDDWQSEFDLDALELGVAGGEPVPTELKDALAEIDVPLIPGFGLTETTDGTIFLRPHDTYDREPDCMGHSFTHVDAAVVDQDGNEVDPGEKGEIVHRGPQVADSYLDDPEATAETWDDGWMHTGDVGERDEDGYISVLGRIDNMIISGGENIYPSEVEEPIYQHPAVEEVIVFGVPSETWGEAVTAVVVTGSDADVDEGDILEFLDGRLAPFKHPKTIEFTDELPKTGSGKIARNEVLEAYGAE